MTRIVQLYADLFGDFASVILILTIMLAVCLIGLTVQTMRCRRRYGTGNPTNHIHDFSILDPDVHARSAQAKRRVAALLQQVHNRTMALAAENVRGRVSLRVAADALGFPKPPRYTRRQRRDRAFNLMRHAARGNGHRVIRSGNVAIITATS